MNSCFGLEIGRKGHGDPLPVRWLMKANRVEADYQRFPVS